MAFKRGWSEISAVRLALGLMVTALALCIGLFVYFVATGAQLTRQRFDERAVAASQVVSTNTYWIAEVANQTLRRVDTALGPAMSGQADEIEAALEGLPAATEIYVIDKDANTIYATIEGASRISVADREYFTTLREGAKFYMSPLLTSRITGDHIFVFSKRVERNGLFAGAIMMSFSEKFLEDLWRTLDLDMQSTVSLVRADGKLMARYPPADTPIDLGASALFTHHLQQADAGTYISDSSPVDGVARVVSFRRVAGTSIIALASVATSPGWNTFTGAVVSVLLIVSPVVIGLVLGCWWIVRLLIRDAERAKELQASVDLNTMLFREIHHRVKNNLASVQALVRMQNIPDTAKRDLQSRFAAMAAMHEHIYEQDRYEDIDAHDFIPPVVEQVKQAYGSKAQLHYDLDHVAVDRDHATPLALLLSELVTNALKYAFAEEDGVLAITLRARPDGRATLIVRDNGVGMAGADIDKSMGMRLIRGVVAQMDGEMEFRNEGGVVFEAHLALSMASRIQTAQAG